MGDRIELVGEGRSTATLELVGGQIALLDALAVIGTPMLVLLMASKPLVLPGSAMNAAADLVRPARWPAADLLQPDPWAARRPVRRSEPEPVV
ncbi:hypothetical protein [Cryobacterium breve]|uniref:hypothetical protein n=1 Tax=Cryobacterium breve TaxID=1259258 RepID=UPI0030D400C0